MGIISLVTDVPGQIGDQPRRPKLISTDNLASITTAGYLNEYNLQGQVIIPTDVIDAFYSWSSPSSPGTYAQFTVSITNGVITLVEWTNPGNVLLPVTNNHVAVFNGTTGQIKDGGVLGNSAAKAVSDNTKATVASVSASVVSGNLAKFADTAGTVADQGVAMKSVAQAAVAGGAAAQTVTDAFCTTGSCVVASWNDTSNAASIQKVVAGNGSFVVTSSADPGASHLNYIITK